MADYKKTKKEKEIKRAIILAYGKNEVGVLFNICKILNDNKISVLDIKQTIVAGYFNLMAMTDITNVKDKMKVKKEFDILAKKLNISINFQLEQTFLAMHQV